MKWLRNILKGASLTTALFIFQACYGTAAGLEYEPVSFKVISAEDGTPAGGVKVSGRTAASSEWTICGYTAGDGILVTGYDPSLDGPVEFRFESEDMLYESKDTVLTGFNGAIVEIKLVKAE